MANVRTGARLGTNGNLGVAFLFAVGARRGAGLAMVQRVLGQFGFPVEVRGRRGGVIGRIGGVGRARVAGHVCISRPALSGSATHRNSFDDNAVSSSEGETSAAMMPSPLVTSEKTSGSTRPCVRP